MTVRRNAAASLFSTALLVTALSSHARSNPEYDDCLLQHLKNAKLDVAAQMITQACRETHVDGNFMMKRDRKRNECLLDNLPGIESVDAFARVTEVCERKSKEK